MKILSQIILGALLAFSLDACATKPITSCNTPPLTDAEVTAIADTFLQQKNMNPEFRKKAERRITQRGCVYEYEEAEKLDSFGVGIVVVVDRNRKVIDFHSDE